MTGPTHYYNRQHSSTTASSNMEKTHSSKLRRCSSADDHNSLELIPDDTHHKEFLSYKREQTTSDDDSGTEEIEQQLEQIYISTSNAEENNLTKKTSGFNNDEGFSECETQEESQVYSIKNDLQLAKTIPDESKKDFCTDTTLAFHGEFARLISVPLSLCRGARYYLFTEEELLNVPNMILNPSYLKLDNAKAQFKCPKIGCQHAWTSMRARISFSISGPEPGIIILKIFGQSCQRCTTHVDAVWYIDEVCRVMKNLAKFVFETYFLDMINNVDLEIQRPVQNNIQPSRLLRHDPTQRRGKMLAPHAKEFCEACQRGLCFV